MLSLDDLPLPMGLIIPADMDQSGYIGVNDLALIQELILGINDYNTFAFIHEDIDMSSLDPFDFGTDIYSFSFEGVDVSTTNFVFNVHVFGDVNQSSQFAPEGNIVEERQSNLMMSFEDFALVEGVTYEIPFTVESDKLIEGFQVGAQLDGISISDIKLEDTTHELKTNVTESSARLLMVTDEPSNLIQGTLTILANRDGMLSELLSLEATYFDEVVYDDLSTGGLDIEFRTALATGDLSVEDVNLSPNPAFEEVSITFPESIGKTTIYISNAQGQLISTQTVSGLSLIHI